MSFLVRPCASRTHYEVLDLSPDECDPKVIEEAALVCTDRVRVYQLTCETECTLRLKEIAEALMTLLDPVRRREYDLSLGKPPSPALSEGGPLGSRSTPVLLQQIRSAPPRLRSDTRIQLCCQKGTCDVRLVYRVSTL
jgi:hypothetical protein